MQNMQSSCQVNSVYQVHIHQYPGRLFISFLFPVYGMLVILRDGSLISCGVGMEDILIYVVEFSSPLSDLCRYFDLHSRTSDETP